MTEGQAYGALLEQLGSRHGSLFVVDAGLATSTQTACFAATFPERYVNLGIAEANAVGFASGLARRGFRPIVHSFGNFLARRAHDQIAVSIALPGLPVILVGATCGVFDGRNGPSHFAADDLAAFLAMPGFTVFEPADVKDLSAVLEWSIAVGGPVYLRLRRHGMPAAVASASDARCPIRAIDAPTGDAAITLVAIGAMLDDAVTAGRMLADEGIAVELLHVLCLKPLEPTPILESARRTGRVAMIENHVAHGGAASALTMLLAAEGIPCHALSLPDAILPAGEPRWLLSQTRLDATSISERIAQLLFRNPVACSATSAH